MSLIASQILRGFPGLGEAALRLTVSALVLSSHFLSAGVLEYKLVIYCVCVYGVCVYWMCVGCMFPLSLQFSKCCIWCHNWDWSHLHPSPHLSYIWKGHLEATAENAEDPWGETE